VGSFGYQRSTLNWRRRRFMLGRICQWWTSRSLNTTDSLKLPRNCRILHWPRTPPYLHSAAEVFTFKLIWITFRVFLQRLQQISVFMRENRQVPGTSTKRKVTLSNDTQRCWGPRAPSPLEWTCCTCLCGTLVCAP